MIDISFEVNGRKVSPNNIGNALEAAMLSSVKDSISKSVGSIRCAEHNQKPKIKAKGRSIDSLSLEVTGCCDALIEQVKKKIS
ncbi:MAG: hypothetical protein RPU64_11255 [Candidatus Sedimenticola sp. (ex Thyasira tokunagai)]